MNKSGQDGILLRLKDGDKIFTGAAAADDDSEKLVYATAVYGQKEAHYVRRFGHSPEEILQRVTRESEFWRRKMQVSLQEFSPWVSSVLLTAHRDPDLEMRIPGRSIDRFAYEVGKTWREIGQTVIAQRGLLYKMCRDASQNEQIEFAVAQAVEEKDEEIEELKLQLAALKAENASLRGEEQPGEKRKSA